MLDPVPLGLPPRTMPNLNTYRILDLVWKRKSISRIEVAQILGLTKSTVTKIITPLLTDGLVLESPVDKVEGRGRPRIALQLNQERGSVLGLEVRTDGWTAVWVRLDGTPLWRKSGTGTWDSERIVDQISDLIHEWQSDRKGRPPLLGVGVSLPGIVDPELGLLVESNPLGIAMPMAIQAALEEKLSIPVTVENDARCGSWGELAFMSQGVREPFLFLLCEDRLHRAGTEGRVAAVGFGLVLDGKVWRGPNHSAGEFSSVLKASIHQRDFQFNLPNERMVKVFEDPEVEAELVEDLGRNLALLVNFLNLKTVYVAWPPSGNGLLARQSFSQLIRSNWLYGGSVECRIAEPSGGPEAVAWGAAGFFLETLFGSADDTQPRWK